MSLDFSGQKIRQLQAPSPYRIVDLLILGEGIASGSTLSLREAYQTGSYNYEKFHKIPTDLAIEPAGITFSNKMPSVGSNLVISALITNKGAATQLPITVQFYEGDPTASGKQIGTGHTINGLGEGANVTLSQNWNPSAEGEKAIYVVINRDRTIVEFDYANNIASKTLKVSGAVTDIPTLSEWATLILLTLLLGMGG